MHKIKHNVLEKAATFVSGQNIKSVPRLGICAECKYFATSLYYFR